MKSLIIVSLVAGAATAFSPAGLAYAQGVSPSTEVPRTAGQIPTRDQPGGDGIAANGRCGGVSYGTGARRCGDQSGGPSGGNNSRN